MLVLRYFVAVLILRRVAKNQWGGHHHHRRVWGPRRARTEDLRIKRAIWVCGLTRILLISCVIASQRLARRGGRSRARADSLRTLSVFHWLRRVRRRCPRRIPQACDPSRRSSPLFLPFGGGRGLNFGLPNAVASRRPSARQPGGATARTLARRSNAPRSNDTPKLASSRTRPERPWIGGKGARRSAR